MCISSLRRNAYNKSNDRNVTTKTLDIVISTNKCTNLGKLKIKAVFSILILYPRKDFLS